ncbi:MAG TPA: DUF2007 domain-containing protein [Nitrospira sp.]|nr:DUF2007 domain-containing protein [Nitrospira sp.]
MNRGFSQPSHRRNPATTLVRLADMYSVGELVILQSLLDGSGIRYVVRHANVSSLYPGVPALTPQMYVEARDLPRAEHLLNRLRLEVREVSDESAKASQPFGFGP